MRIYVSGSITNNETCTEQEINENIRTGLETSMKIRQMGHSILSPFLLSSHWVHAGYSYQEMMYCSYMMILDSEAMFMMPNFSQSKGASDEKEFAEDLGIPIYYSLDEL